MKIYFFSSRISHDSNQAILGVLRTAGASVFSNLPGETLSVGEAESRKLEEGGQTMLDKMDGLVLEGSEASHQAGYLVAYAIANHKPVLYLVEKGKAIEPALKDLENSRVSARFFTASHYSNASLAKMLGQFIKKVEVISGVEAPMIKFTLRITPLIDRYLHWKTHNTPLTKADFMRKVFIDEVIKKDKDYEKILDQ